MEPQQAVLGTCENITKISKNLAFNYYFIIQEMIGYTCMRLHESIAHTYM